MTEQKNHFITLSLFIISALFLSTSVFAYPNQETWSDNMEAGNAQGNDWAIQYDAYANNDIAFNYTTERKHTGLYSLKIDAVSANGVTVGRNFSKSANKTIEFYVYDDGTTITQYAYMSLRPWGFSTFQEFILDTTGLGLVPFYAFRDSSDFNITNVSRTENEWVKVQWYIDDNLTVYRYINDIFVDTSSSVDDSYSNDSYVGDDQNIGVYFAASGIIYLDDVSVYNGLPVVSSVNLSRPNMAITFDSVNSTHALDGSGNGHNLLVNLGTPSYVTGVVGDAGNTTEIQSFVPFGWNNEFTYCFSTPAKDSTMTPLNLAGPNGTIQYQFYGAEGYQLAIYQEDASGNYIYGEVLNTPFDGDFHNYCVVYDGGTDTTALNVYIDGVLQNLSNVDEVTPYVFDNTVFSGATNFDIGVVADGQNNLYDEILQYNEALNFSSIQELNNNLTQGCGFPFTCSPETNNPPVVQSLSFTVTNSNQTLILSTNVTDTENVTVTIYTTKNISGVVTSVGNTLLSTGTLTNYLNVTASVNGTYSFCAYAEDGLNTSATVCSASQSITFNTPPTPPTPTPELVSVNGTLQLVIALFGIMLLLGFAMMYVKNDDAKQYFLYGVALMGLLMVVALLFLL